MTSDPLKWVRAEGGSTVWQVFIVWWKSYHQDDHNVLQHKEDTREDNLGVDVLA